MTGLFFDEIRTVGIQTYKSAGGNETNYPEAARKELEGLAVSGGARHELAIKGAAAEAATVAALIRRGYTLDGDTLVPPKLATVQVVVTPPEKENEVVSISIEMITTARDYLSTTQATDRFGKQRHYINLDLDDVCYNRDSAAGQENGWRETKEGWTTVFEILQQAGVTNVSDLSGEDQYRVAYAVRKD